MYFKTYLHVFNFRFHRGSAYGVYLGKVSNPVNRPGVAQRVGRGITLFFQDLNTRRRRVVSSTPRPHFTPGKDPVPILQEAGWAPRQVWTGAENLARTGIRSPDRQDPSHSLYRLSYPAHVYLGVTNYYA
jgi:hypothetical protein